MYLAPDERAGGLPGVLLSCSRVLPRLMNIGALPRRCRPFSLTESYVTPGQNTTPGRAGALFRLRIMRAGPKSWKFVEIGKDRGEFGIETLKGVL